MTAILSEHVAELKYADLLSFFEIFPHVSYIYEENMTPELYELFMLKIIMVLNDSKFPIEDVTRVFNIVAEISYFDKTQPGEAKNLR